MRVRGGRCVYGAIALALLAVVPCVRANEAAPDDSANSRSAYAGVEVGNTDTRRLLAGGSLRWNDWDFDAQFARAEFELPDIDGSSTIASARVGHDFGQFGVAVGYRRATLEDVSTTAGWNLNGSYRRETLRFSAEIEKRSSSLEPAPFTEDLGEGLGVRSGVSRCEVDSLGYQARVDLDRPTWLGFVSYKVFDYRDFDCLLTIAGAGNGNGNGNGNGPPAHARGRALGRRLGEIALRPVSGFASRLIPREAMLLDSSLALGLTLPVTAQWIGGAELYRDVERVGDSTFDTALVFASRRLNDTWTMELSLGFSDAEDVPDTSFAGIRMSVDL